MKKKAKAMRLFFLVVCLTSFLNGCRRREDETALAEVVLQETDAACVKTDGGMQGADGGEFVSESGGAADTGAQAALQECYIHIYGAVKNPGVYRMEPGDRIFQAVERAGGFTDDACKDYVNQAKGVADGLKIWIPTKQEAEELHEEGAAAGMAAQRMGEAPDEACAADGNEGLFYPQPEAQSGGKININTAAQEELCTLTGIGEAKAQAIIAYREAHGGFEKPEDIMKVTGIKRSGYEKIRDQITVGVR